MHKKKPDPQSTSSKTPPLSRRDFLTHTALIGAGLTAGNVSWAQSPAQPKPANKTKMTTRKLGELEVSALGAGCMSISSNYGPPAPLDGGIQVIRAAFEKVVPGYCQVLHACRTNQMIFIHRTPIYSSSFKSLETANLQMLTQIAGRAFVPLAN